MEMNLENLFTDKTIKAKAWETAKVIGNMAK